ncbi:F-box domain protein [Aspergillus fumigatus Af293]|uniref:F-box domain protein n=1 Tax=Aspergillus fumigatus (strain ATCC MYA-4609 / CBS 101355 / FGSC A1100 / Af293) TaxID=330879 RepID=Q4WHI5_ASPFU|nr:F-box domain protein [Aspergillus fumigatus Af293]EAL87620.2 F-box domain protein [Aspergillus fumigatus Af293]KEY83031.1 hypothetical protein F box [Aspergillus fumigatus]
MVYFPSEIVDIIMSHVGPEDFYTLFQCALVNRQWSRAALRALYRAEGLFPGVHRASAYEHSKIVRTHSSGIAESYADRDIVHKTTYVGQFLVDSDRVCFHLRDLSSLRRIAFKLRYGRFAFELKIIRLENYCNICAAVGWGKSSMTNNVTVGADRPKPF